MRQGLIAAIFLLLGLGVGALGRATWSTSPDPSITKPASDDFESIQHELRGLRAEVSLLRTRTESDPARPPELAPPPRESERRQASEPPPPLVTPQESRQRVQAIIDKELDDFAHQSVDPGWAAEKSSEIRQQLAEISGGHFTTERVECRTRHCVAILSWPDYKTAVDELVFTDSGGRSCARSVLLGPPNEGRTEAQIVYSCR